MSPADTMTDCSVVPGRHNDRVRRLQDEEDEEFTVFSAHDTRFNTTSVRLYNRLYPLRSNVS